MWRNITSNVLTFLVVAVFLLGGVILWGQNRVFSGWSAGRADLPAG